MRSVHLRRFGVLLLVLVGAVTRAEDAPSATPADAPTGITAVVGFQADPALDPRDAWLPTAFEEILSSRLRRAPGILAMPTVRAWQAAREVSGGSSAAPDWSTLLPTLGVARQVTGRVSGQPDAVQVEIELRELGSGRVTQATFGPDRLFVLLDRLTEWLLAQYDAPPLSPEARARVFLPPAGTPSAIEYYAQAVRAARADNPRDVVFYLERAAQYDVRHAPTQLMMAEIEGRTDRAAREAAGQRLRRLLEKARTIGDVVLEIDVELAQAALALQDRSFDSAFARLTRVLEMARGTRDLYSILGALNALGDARLAHAAALTPRPKLADAAPDAPPPDTSAADAELRAAVGYFTEILEHLARVGDVAAEAPVANKLALIYDQLGQADAAYECHQRTLAAAERCGSRSAQATAWMFIGQWHRKQDRLPEAVAATRRCLELADAANQPRVRISLAGLLEQQSLFDEALPEYRAAYEALIGSEDLANQLLCLISIADINTQLGRRAEAAAATREAIDVAHVLESPIKKELEEKLAKLR